MPGNTITHRMPSTEGQPRLAQEVLREDQDVSTPEPAASSTASATEFWEVSGSQCRRFLRAGRGSRAAQGNKLGGFLCCLAFPGSRPPV